MLKGLIIIQAAVLIFVSTIVISDPYDLYVDSEVESKLSGMSDRALLIKRNEIHYELEKVQSQLQSFRGLADQNAQNSGRLFRNGTDTVAKASLGTALIAALSGMDAEQKVDTLKQNLAVVEAEIELRDTKSQSESNSHNSNNKRPITIGEDSFTVEKLAEVKGCVGMANLVKIIDTRSIYQVS